jgi:predicted TIM-barrel fold metal-dependent hydrolase
MNHSPAHPPAGPQTAVAPRPECDAAQPVFDAHLHIIDPAHPLIVNNGYLPEPFTVADYRTRIADLPIAGGAVVSGSFQGFDQDYLVAALADLGPGFVGVTQLPADTTDRRIRELHAAGVRAVRFNVARGGTAVLADLEPFARRVYDLVGWHAEIYIDAAGLDAGLCDRIASLPAVSIDHLGMSAAGLGNLLRLVERGVRVKATGFGRIDIDPAKAIRAIMDIDPGALMVGTDLPSTRARRPFQEADFDIVRAALHPDEVPKVFWDNAAQFYPGADRR